MEIILLFYFSNYLKMDKIRAGTTDSPLFEPISSLHHGVNSMRYVQLCNNRLHFPHDTLTVGFKMWILGYTLNNSH